MKNLNVYATKEIVEKLIEANKRGYWKVDENILEELKKKYLELEGLIEENVEL